MAKEIERKFKVFPHLLPELKHGERVIQGYLCESPQIRFRVWKNKVVLTVKSPLSDGSRFELECEKLSPADDEIEMLCALAKGRVIYKTRYSIPYEGLVWEIDVYLGDNEGLITVDVELPSPDWEIAFPHWVDQQNDITYDKKYFNINLSKNPYKTW